MRTASIPAMLLALSFMVPGALHASQLTVSAAKDVAKYAPDRILVRFKPGTAASEISRVHRMAHGQSLRSIPGIDVQVVKVQAGTVAEKVALYEANPNVEYAEPDYYRLLRIPSEDPGPAPAGGDLFEEQWYLNNTGQWHTAKRTTLVGSSFTKMKGRRDADIDAPEGWEITTGMAATGATAPNIAKIAVLDSGVSCVELDLQNKCLEQVNVVQDYVPKSQQLWDGVDSDVVGHGTFVASEAAADTDNALGIAGTGWNTDFGSFKVCYQELVTDGVNLSFVGLCPVSASADAIMRASTDRFAADGTTLLRSQYHVITMSYGSDSIAPDGTITPTTPSNAECDAIQAAWDNGVVVVAAAGNNGDTGKVYPAACTHTGTGQSTVIAVAASDDSDNRAGFSTYSTDLDDWVSLAAPGEWIVGILPHDHCGLVAPTDNCVDWWNGTSMAAPLVAGSAALVWARLYAGEVDDPLASPAACTVAGLPCNQVVRERLENGADTVGANGQDLLEWTQHGRLNLEQSLATQAPAICGDGLVSGGELCDTADPGTNVVDCAMLGNFLSGQDASCSACTSYVTTACIPSCTITESPAELSCSDGQDNDCDGVADAGDPDCSTGTLLPKGAACTLDSECASGRCKGRSGNQVCK
ncbi:MAG TPA: S8 family serine peptidase [Gammaproteobacteria bacterium]|nr:S8 family serine peptidase [Gammaproteobacteria bacterium]